MVHASSTQDFAIRKTAAHDARSKLCEQIDEALRCLDDEKPSGTKIHDARKAIKRSRATLRLLRDVLPEQTYRLENVTLRNAARPLSAVRDARVLIEQLDNLVAREHFEPREATGFRAALGQEQHHLRRKIARDHTGFQRTRNTLRDARHRMASSKVDSRGWSDLSKGLRRVYARGRKALREARTECTTQCLHEWRKQSKYLMYQLELLEPIAPDPIDELADCAHRLSNRLGDDHDLTVLRQKALAHANAFRARGELDALIEAIEHRQSRLRKKAFKIGAKLYDEKPAQFRMRFDRYWKRAREP
jgi:CHAD domain-containing protein